MFVRTHAPTAADNRSTVSFALNPIHGALLSKLIVVDIAPSVGAISPDFANYLKGMRKVQEASENGSVKTRKDADAILAEYESVSLFCSPFCSAESPWITLL